jgi:phosphoribosyl 1,2-cyclic phosphodiesterase
VEDPLRRPIYKLRFWGVRGTVPTPAPENLSFGGNTVCLSVSLNDRKHLILDCGSGLRLLGNQLAGLRQGVPRRYDIFLSHYHFDHVEGLPFFHPLYEPESIITFHGFKSEGRSVREILESLFTPPYFPVKLAGVPARVRYLTAGGRSRKVGDVVISSLPLRHPNGSLSYRLEHAGKRIVFATDHEHGDEPTDRALIRFSEGADYLIYDATYIPGEYESLRRGWGHSTWYAAVQVARAARVKTLVLFHHHPDHTDKDLRDILRVARRELPSTEIAREGMELPF